MGINENWKEMNWLFLSGSVIYNNLWSSLGSIMFVCVSQVCLYCYGGIGPAADGLSLSEYKPFCGKFPYYGAQAAGGRQTQLTDPGH